MQAVQKNQLLVWALLHLSTCEVPPIESVAASFPSYVGATLVLSRVSLSAHTAPSLFLPFSSSTSTFMQYAYHIAISLPE